MPVSARRSVVLPWSMWPAVPMTTLGAGRASAMAAEGGAHRRGQRRVVGRLDGSQVEHDRAVARSARRPPASRPAAGASSRSGSADGDARPPATGAPGPAATRRRPSPRPRRRSHRRRSPRRPPPPGRRAARRARRSGARPGCRASPRRPGRARGSRRPRPAATLSGRIARASGSLRSRATRSARPTMSPACGPPTSLSPLNVTRSAPSASRSPGIGSWARPNAAVSSSAPLPRSSTTSAPCRWAAAASAGASGASTNPAWLKFDGWTRRTRRARPSASASSKSAARVRFVVPTSTSLAPARRTISGIRTPPPISTSSPRLTATPPAARQPHRERDGRRVVDDDQRVLGAGQRDQVRLGLPVPAAPAARSRGPAPGTACPRRPRGRRGWRRRGHGARPRFVWTMTPVALMTRSGPADCSRAVEASGESRPRSSAVARRRPVGRGRARRARSSSTTARAIARTAAGSRSAVSGRARPQARVRRSGGAARPTRSLTRDHRRPVAAVAADDHPGGGARP